MLESRDGGWREHGLDILDVDDIFLWAKGQCVFSIAVVQGRQGIRYR